MWKRRIAALLTALLTAYAGFVAWNLYSLAHSDLTKLTDLQAVKEALDLPGPLANVQTPVWIDVLFLAALVIIFLGLNKKFSSPFRFLTVLLEQRKSRNHASEEPKEKIAITRLKTEKAGIKEYITNICAIILLIGANFSFGVFNLDLLFVTSVLIILHLVIFMTRHAEIENLFLAITWMVCKFCVCLVICFWGFADVLLFLHPILNSTESTLLTIAGVSLLLLGLALLMAFCIALLGIYIEQ